MARQSYESRLENCNNPLLRKLFRIIIEKRSNLCIAVDFSNLEETLDFIDRVGKHVCIIKVHPEEYGLNLEDTLIKLDAKKREYNFLLFVDRKFYDSPDTIGKQYSTYVKYADLVTMVPISGDNSYKHLDLAVKAAHLPEDQPRGCLAVIETSFESRLKFIDSKGDLEIAEKNSHICIGIVAQDLQVPNINQMIKATPGVHMHQTANASSQRWKPPAQVIDNGADVIIVGRGIIASPKDEQEGVAIQYKEAGWQAYLGAK